MTTQHKKWCGYSDVGAGRPCSCGAAQTLLLGYCAAHNRKYDADEGCELCLEDAAMVGTTADETAYCDGCAQHVDSCLCAKAAPEVYEPTVESLVEAIERKKVTAAELDWAIHWPCPVRAKVLQRGIDLTTGDRNKTYGPPEPNLTLQMEFWKLYKAMAGDKHSMAHDAAMQHVFAKLARIASGPPLHEDNYVDLSTYSAIAYECDVEVLGVEKGQWAKTTAVTTV